MIPSKGGRFELTVRGKLIYSKLATGKFPDVDDMVRAVDVALGGLKIGENFTAEDAESAEEYGHECRNLTPDFLRALRVLRGEISPIPFRLDQRHPR